MKWPIPVIQMLKEEFFDQPLEQTNWWSSLKEALLPPNRKDHLKVLKDYILMVGELYRKLPEGVLARCLSLDESIKQLKKFTKNLVALTVLSVFTNASSGQDITC